MKLNTTVAGLAAATAVFAGSVLVAVPAIAQDTTTDTTTTEEGLGTEVRCPDGRHGELTTAADVLGLEAGELRDRLAAGETVADIAVTEGVALDDVIAALVEEAEGRLDDAVADGRLAQAEADERLAAIEQRITAFVNGDLAHFGGRGFGGPGPFGFSAAAGVLGLDPADLMEQLRAGAPLGEIAAEQGVQVDELKAAMTAHVTERLEEAVANGDLTQEQADERLADIETRLDRVIDGELPAGGAGLHRHGRGLGLADAAGDAVETIATGA